MWPATLWAGWPGPMVPPPGPSPSRNDLILARTRHPSFTPAVARELVSPLSRLQLRRLWRSSTRLLEGRGLSCTHRLHLVLLREQVLDRLDRLDTPS